MTTSTDQASRPIHRRSREHDLGELLRRLAGVDERLLDRVPAERPRYTGLGGVVLGTATIGAISMWFALGQVLGGVTFWLVFPALVWGLFILNLDRWLVSTSCGTHWGRRLSVLIPRLGIALVLGIIIAEPIVLRVFQTAVEERIHLTRQAQDGDLRGQLARCNPEPDAAGMVASTTGDDSCGRYRLTIADTPNAIAGQLSAAARERDRLQTRNESESARIKELTVAAQGECDRTAGTMQRGYGQQCLDKQRDLANYQAAHPPAAHQREVADQQAVVAGLESQLKTQKSDYLAKRSEAIDRRVALQVGSRDAIGLLERFKALDELVDRNLFLLGALWMIRLFFVLIDCMPVLVKLFSGTSTYDELVDRDLRRAKRVFIEESKTREDEETLHDIQRRTQIASELRRSAAAVEADEQQHQVRLNRDEARLYAEVDAEEEARIDRLTQQILTDDATPRTVPLNGQRVNGHAR